MRPLFATFLGAVEVRCHGDKEIIKFPPPWQVPARNGIDLVGEDKTGLETDLPAV